MNSTGTITWGLTDWATGLPSNSATIVQPVCDTPLLDGNYLVTGLPRRYIASSGTFSAVLHQGNYALSVEHEPHLQPLYISVPGDSGTYGLGDIRLSGGNVFVQSGVRKLTSNDNSVTLNPANGAGVVDLSFSGISGTNSNVIVNDLTCNGTLALANAVSRLNADGSASFAGGRVSVDADGNFTAGTLPENLVRLASNGVVTFGGGTTQFGPDGSLTFGSGTLIDGLGAITATDSIQTPQLNLGATADFTDAALSPALTGGLAIGGIGWNVLMDITGIKPDHGYNSSDGSPGITATQSFKDGSGATKTMTIKNGLIVGIA